MVSSKAITVSIVFRAELLAVGQAELNMGAKNSVAVSPLGGASVLPVNSGHSLPR
jgi:hypothetical protein